MPQRLCKARSFSNPKNSPEALGPPIYKNITMFTIKALPFSNYDTTGSDSLNWIPAEDERKFLKHNAYKCACCGLVSRPHRDFPSGYMEIFNSSSNKYVLCNMCMQSQYLGRSVNGKSNHGLIVYCPSLTQGQLIKLALWAYIARLRGNKFAASANKLIGMVTKDLVKPASNCIPGFNNGDVREFTDIYEYMSPKVRKNSSKILSDLRYWPNEIIFESQVKFWNASAFQNVTDNL